MENHELKELKKTFKQNASSKFELESIINIYWKKTEDGFKKIFNKEEELHSLDTRIIEKYYQIGEKMLTGKIFDKVIPVKFKEDATGRDSQIKFCDLLDIDSFEDELLVLGDKIVNTLNFNSDIVLTAMLGKSILQQKNPKEKAEKGVKVEKAYMSHSFVMFFITEVVTTKNEITIDSHRKKIAVEPSTIILDAKNPVEGVLFPGMTDWKSDINEVLYLSNKKGRINTSFVEDVLNCQKELTLSEEKALLNLVLKESKDKLGLKDMTKLMNDLNSIEKDLKVSELIDIFDKNGISDSEEILKDNGVSPNIELKNESLDLTKSVKLKDTNLSIALDLTELVGVEEVVHGSQKYLKIPINGDLNLNDILLKK